MKRISSKLRHVAISADGNRRWAKEHGIIPSYLGHNHIIDHCINLSTYMFNRGVSTVTLWLLAPHNLKRSTDEVSNLLKCIDNLSNRFDVLSDLHQYQMMHLGTTENLPEYLKKTIYRTMPRVTQHRERVLNLGINYSSREELVRAFRKLQKENQVINANDIALALDTGYQKYPNADIIIRTGKVSRTSGFFHWQSDHAELSFPQKYFPDLTEHDLDQIFDQFDKNTATKLTHTT